MPRPALPAVAAAVLLAGCSLLPKLQPHPAPTAASHRAPGASAPRHAPAASRAASGSSVAAARLHPGTATAALEASPPVQVVGLSQDAVRRLLGAPSGEASQGPAQTWTYQGADCRVQIAFFFDVTRNGFFALSQRSPEGGNAAACLGRIRDAHDA